VTECLVAPPNGDQSSDMLAPMKSNAVDGRSRLGRLVRTKRVQLDLTQDALAERAHVSRNTITQLEAGHTSAPKSLPRILGVLDIDVADLLGEIPAPVIYEPPPGSAPPLAHLSDAQLASEASRLVAEMAARLAARPVATAVPAPGTHGVVSATDPPIGDNHSDTAR
jgi:transcriptional regulator with XRE-family HTH domain